jgi:hypothetical protein
MAKTRRTTISKRYVTVDTCDLDILLDCFTACAHSRTIDDWCVDVGNDRDAVNAAEDRLRESVGKVPYHK